MGAEDYADTPTAAAGCGVHFGARNLVQHRFVPSDLLICSHRIRIDTLQPQRVALPLVRAISTPIPLTCRFLNAEQMEVSSRGHRREVGVPGWRGAGCGHPSLRTAWCLAQVPVIASRKRPAGRSTGQLSKRKRRFPSCALSVWLGIEAF